MANTTAVIVLFGSGIPEAPTNLLATLDTVVGTVNLSWYDASDNENNFRIYKSIDGINFTYVNSIDSNLTSYSIGEIINKQNYWFRVSACNTAGESTYAQFGSLNCDWGTFYYIPKMKRISRNRKTL